MVSHLFFKKKCNKNIFVRFYSFRMKYSRKTGGEQEGNCEKTLFSPSSKTFCGDTL